MGMGACQAIEDAVVLADALAREPSVDAALARYQTRRISRANSFVTRSFRFGQLAHLRIARFAGCVIARCVPSVWCRVVSCRASRHGTSNFNYNFQWNSASPIFSSRG